MASAVLDSSAVLALLRNEPGWEKVAGVIGAAIISTVNVQEVWKVLLMSGVPPEIAREMVDELKLDVRPHDLAAAWDASNLARQTARHGSGLGDRTCLALAIAVGAPAYTADREWNKLEIDGLRVQAIR